MRKAGGVLKDNIKRLRAENGLSQDDLAERVHVVRQTVSKWERGASVPDAETLAALANALDTTPNELLGMPGAGAAAFPEGLSWKASLLDERLTHEAGRTDRLMAALRWMAVGAGIVCVTVLMAWLPTQHFIPGAWASPTDNPNYNRIVYTMNGEEKQLRLFLDSEHYDRVVALAGDHDLIAQLDAEGEYNRPNSCEALSDRANEEIERNGGTVLRHELWIEGGNLNDGDPLYDDMPYSTRFFASPDVQDASWG